MFWVETFKLERISVREKGVKETEERKKRHVKKGMDRYGN